MYDIFHVHRFSASMLCKQLNILARSKVFQHPGVKGPVDDKSAKCQEKTSISLPNKSNVKEQSQSFKGVLRYITPNYKDKLKAAFEITN